MHLFFPGENLHIFGKPGEVYNICYASIAKSQNAYDLFAYLCVLAYLCDLRILLLSFTNNFFLFY